MKEAYMKPESPTENQSLESQVTVYHAVLLYHTTVYSTKLGAPTGGP